MDTVGKVAEFAIPKLDDVDVNIVPETNNPLMRNNLHASTVALAGDISSNDVTSTAAVPNKLDGDIIFTRSAIGNKFRANNVCVTSSDISFVVSTLNPKCIFY